MDSGYKRTLVACFVTTASTAITGNLSPLLFLTFHSVYGISFSLLGLLVVINFGTQLIFDLAFSFFSHKFNLAKSVRLTPLLMAVGLFIYAVCPFLAKDNVFLWLSVGTVIFSAGSGLSEVLTSPTVAALPSENSEKTLTMLHSFYAWGVVAVVFISAGFFYVFGAENWQYLALAFSLVPLVAFIMLSGAPIPKMQTTKKASGAVGLFKNKNLVLCTLCIFLGGAAECTMSQWCSSYLEQALGIPKVTGDILGVAVFGFMLGTGRTLYAKFGKNTEKLLFFGAIGATVCYVTSVVSGIPVVGLCACAFTGFFVSMMWPGSLIISSERIPEGGVAVYALMAAGGDLGASICPQLVGIITDFMLAGTFGASLSQKLSMDVEQLSMKSGMAFASLFPLLAVIAFGIALKTKKQNKKQS